MQAKLQEQIAPRDRTISSAAPGIKKAATAKVDGSPTDFQKLLVASAEEAKSNKKAETTGDLANAASYEDFLNGVNKKEEKGRQPKNTLSKDDFLNLFITQLKAQDPLNPKDGAEMASQLAQFNGLEQMLNVNTTLKRLEEQNTKAQNMSFANYVGKEAFVDNGKVRINQGQISEVSFDIDHAVGQANFTLKDDQGKVVLEKNLGPLEAGPQKLAWSASEIKADNLADGLYTMAVNAIGKDNSQVPVEIQTKVRITGVDLKKSEAGFYSDLGRVAFADLAKIGDKGFSNAALIRPKALPTVENPGMAKALDQTSEETPLTADDPLIPPEIRGGVAADEAPLEPNHDTIQPFASEADLAKSQGQPNAVADSQL